MIKLLALQGSSLFLPICFAFHFFKDSFFSLLFLENQICIEKERQTERLSGPVAIA